MHSDASLQTFRCLTVAEQVAEHLRGLIRAGRWASGAQLPAVRQLAERLGVSLNSAQEALRLLSEAGLVELRPRQGAFVKVRVVADGGAKRDQVAVVRSFATPEDAAGYADAQVRAEEEPVSWWQRIVHAMERKLAAEAGWHLVSLPFVADAAGRGVADVIERIDSLQDRLAGVLLYGGEVTRLVQQALDERGIPWLTTLLPDRRSVYNFVTADNFGGGLRVGHCLAQMGVRRVLVLVSSPPTHSSTAERTGGLYQAFIQRELPTRQIDVVACHDVTEQAGHERVRRYLGQVDEPPEAVFAHGDLLALGAIRACREAGLRVPEDVGVIGGTGLSLGRYASPPLTVLAQPMEAMGQHAALMLIEMAREGVLRMVGRRIPSPIMFRDSIHVPAAIRRELEAEYQAEWASIQAPEQEDDSLGGVVSPTFTSS